MSTPVTSSPSNLARIALLRSQTPPPALLERSEAEVPELSASARGRRDEGAAISTTTSTPAG